MRNICVKLCTYARSEKSAFCFCKYAGRRLPLHVRISWSNIGFCEYGNKRRILCSH